MLLCLTAGLLAEPAFVATALAEQTVAPTTGAATQPDEDPAVVALLDEIEATYASAAKLTGKDQREALLKVKALLTQIASDYPASDVSLTIALGDKVGSVDPVTLDAQIAALGPEVSPGADAVADPAVAASLTEPLLKVLHQCLISSSLPQAGDDAATVTIRLVTGQDGAVSSMPDLLDPAAPSDAQRKLFNRALLALAACTEFSAAQRNSTVEVSISSAGVTGGTVIQTEPTSPVVSQTAVIPEPTADANVVPTLPVVVWTAATSETQTALSLKRKDFAELQARLTASGYDPKGIDGAPGAGMRTALAAWQTSVGIPSTGYLDGPQFARLLADTQPAFEAWQAVSANAKLLAKAAAPRQSGTRRGHNGWYRTGGNYCRQGMFGLWCQTWKPAVW